jgi:NAD+ kinase
MKTVGIIYNDEKPRAVKETIKIKSWLKKRGCRAVVLPSSAKQFKGLDFAVCLGGDGTMLKASAFLAPAGIPVLGVNLGSLGFLAETDPGECLAFLDRILKGDFKIEERAMLSITVERNKNKLFHTALNDCMIHSGNNGRVLTVTALLNGEFLGDYIGDGLIVATPTGSTAYSLAASGPIVHPNLSVFLLTPICPHTLTQRPMIVSANHTLTLTADASTVREKPVLSIDGQTSYLLNPGDKVTVSCCARALKLIVNPERKYLEVLRAKLSWGRRG